ncbi:type II toxin-antitoxin system VapC family toxin [Halomonas campaniensis]|uniref:Twitching motility protein PilT n=1 Tax=Halomonas campaniensis TaxID=213554 RepID=A0A246RYP5_9GAMM|nr:type II toxin-antitoxin system VapC family toxin [Halomonas campaniensis]OWV29278.1 twitching motility protein PilT [Halomonas campaniensis]
MQVLDTHVWLWWMSGDKRLKPKLREAIENDACVGVSAISLFEVAWLVEHQRIDLGCALEWWFEQALDASNITLLPITPTIAERAAKLPEHHSDPQDRIIIATALAHQAKILSADSKFKLYKELNSLLVR